jgi:HAE1 family hydrophobic/amphiphilic exporter-1
MQATLRGVKEVGIAIIAGTLTTIIVFVPIMFGAQTDISVFMTHVGVTIIVALLASLFITQTLVPMLAARIDIPPVPKSGSVMSCLTKRYVNGLGWILRKPWKTFAGIILICLIGVAPLVLDLVKLDAFPQDVGRRLYMPLHIEGEHPLERVEANVATIEDYLFENQEAFDIDSVYSYYDKREASVTILLTDEIEATLSTTEIVERIEENMPIIAIGKPSFVFDQQGGGEGFSLQISGDSTAVLN